jgi:hypothetical protein
MIARRRRRSEQKSHYGRLAWKGGRMILTDNETKVDLLNNEAIAAP